MELAISLVATIVLGWTLSAMYRRAYSLIFHKAQKPLLWCILVTLMSGLFWFVCGYFGLPASVAAWASTMAIAINWSRGQETPIDAVALKRGTLLYRLGFGGFIVAAIVGWIMFYGKVCNMSGECAGFF